MKKLPHNPFPASLSSWDIPLEFPGDPDGADGPVSVGAALGSVVIPALGSVVAALGSVLAGATVGATDGTGVDRLGEFDGA